MGSTDEREDSQFSGSESGSDDFKTAVTRRCGPVTVCLVIYGSIALGIGWLIGRATVPAGPPGPPIQLVQTAKGTDARLDRQADLHLGPDFGFSGAAVSVLSAKPEAGVHPIVGFGGAFTESAALVFRNLTAIQQERVLQGYFGPDGLGYTVGRTHINSCDFSVNNYAFDDVDGDLELVSFDNDVTRDTQALIPFIKVAQKTLSAHGRDLKLLATPWSPPAWMKTNRKMDHSGKTCLRAGMQHSWAKYFTKWLDAYKAHGVPVWAVTVQNEPESNATWEGCLFTPEEATDFLASYLGPELQASHPEVKIFVYDHNKDHVYTWANATYSHPTAYQYATGVAYHWYSGDGFENLRSIQRDFPQAELLASEATWERWRWQSGVTLEQGDWSFGEGYGHDIIGDLNVGSIGWIDWNLLLDANGGPNHVNNVCDAVMMANFSTGELFTHPQFYYIGHFSKYILPGSRLLPFRVSGTTRFEGLSKYACGKDDPQPCRGYGVCSGVDGLQATAFLRPDNQVVVVALNCGDAAIEFKLQFVEQAAAASIPPHAIQTYFFDAGAEARVVI